MNIVKTTVELIELHMVKKSHRWFQTG